MNHLKLQLKIPPVVQGALAMAGIWLAARYLPLCRFEFRYQTAAAWILAGAGLLVAVAGILAFIKLKTTVDPRRPDEATELVIIGIYRYSRNPMYLGILLVLAGAAIYSGAFSTILVAASFVWFINRFQIAPEEAALQNKFKESYRRYRQKVRRWL
ncbi:MAG: isoprenylcysteine carboxylmethyltransferase family protein [Proteobacteria bacterium]|nr:isoprenylcysteine carboxylmethyltransferase family protein [Pseudomonadota bacterium]MBU1737059.1 isoprenylcysteine carboxylmethyltransferase family protein [Pseudomonadota bacterium]